MVAFLYQFTLAFSVNNKVLDGIKYFDKEILKLEEDQKAFFDIHSQLDNYRDRLIFDQDEKYWEILEQLNTSGKV